MKLSILILATVSLLTIISAYGQDANKALIIAKPVQITSSDDIPANLSYEVKPMGYKPGFKIHYLLKPVAGQ